MIKPTRVGVFLTAAILSGGLLWGALDSAAASDADADAPTKPRAYLFRGFAGMIFSRGTDDLADRIEKAGFHATVDEAVMCPQIARDAIADYRRDPALIVLIGHSMGGTCAISFAEMLEAEHIPVSLLVTTEPNRISHKVPLNVERYIDIYQSNSLLGGFDAVPAPGFRGHVATFDLVKHSEISHVNMEKDGAIQEQVMNKILELAETPAKAEGQSVPIHYVVPADAPIELWDSGKPVVARSGDTLEALAAANQVPLWALTQANHLPDGTPLMVGAQVVVPRHLGPVAVQTSFKTSAQKHARH
jgi:LysM repeat protein